MPDLASLSDHPQLAVAVTCAVLAVIAWIVFKIVKRTVMLFLMFVLVVVALGGGGAYYFWPS
jgi:hypothetical protein